jgi:hypothetical protein
MHSEEIKNNPSKIVLTHNCLCYRGKYLRAFSSLVGHSGSAWTVIAVKPVLAGSTIRAVVLLMKLALIDVWQSEKEANLKIQEVVQVLDRGCSEQHIYVRIYSIFPLPWHPLGTYGFPS